MFFLFKTKRFIYYLVVITFIMKSEQKNKQEIETRLVRITPIKPEGPHYCIEFKVPQEQGERRNDSIKIDAKGLDNIINAYGDKITGKPINTALIGEELVAFYDTNHRVKWIKPYVLYLKPRIN